MKLDSLFEGEIKPWKFTAEDIMMDNKGKIQFLHPELRGPAQCPFWKALKTKIAANLKEGSDDVKVPKSFAIEVGKEYKVPLDPTYSTPMCIGPKICAHFKGVGKGTINCDFKLGVKAGPEKKVDVASTTEPVPAENKAEAPVKEEVGAERGSVPAVSERVKQTSATPTVGLTDGRPGDYPTDTMTEKNDMICGKCKHPAYKDGEDVKCGKCKKTEAHCNCTPKLPIGYKPLTEEGSEGEVTYKGDEDGDWKGDKPNFFLSNKQQEFVKKVEADGLKPYFTYSGRGMYGRKCPAVNVDSLGELSFNPNKYSTDQMGLGYVVYCPY